MTGALRAGIVGVLARHPEVIGAYLFGSRSRSEATVASDLDLGILCNEPLALAALIALEDELDSATGGRVDLVDLARADPFLALDVVRGDRIYERDGRRLDEFDLHVLRRAADLAPFERERRRMFLSAGSP